MTSSAQAGTPEPDLTVVIPVNNEAENLIPLVAEIETALSGKRFELIFVDDGSTDDSAQILARLAASRPWLRRIRHDRACGKSAALRSGVLGARSLHIVMLDGDGQNDPKYIPNALEALQLGGEKVGLVNSVRIGRKDTAFKRLQSRIANRVRAAILHDGTLDSVSGLKAFRRDVFLSLPIFDGLHRFMPALVRREGLSVVQIDVSDRPRMGGRTHYGMWDRLWVGLLDLAGVWWLIRRRKRVPRVSEVQENAG